MNELYYDGRMLLIYLAVKYEGDFNKIMSELYLHNTNIPYEDAIKVYKSLPCKTLTFLDYDYPQKLKEIKKPPIVLFYYGDISLLDKQIFAVVGSRNYSEYGKTCAEQIIKEVCKGRVILSGLARGIDTIAHQAAIDNGGKTIAVLGSGIDNCYPTENKELYEEIKKNHLLISEYPFNATPDSVHFPMRNRIIVGLSDAVYVPQINTHQSGTMITINLALSCGREIFVAPHPPGSPTINNQMINEGAILADTGRQILEELKWDQK
jgi:DNA processing protein